MDRAGNAVTVYRFPFVAIAIEWPTQAQLVVLGIWTFVISMIGLSVYLALRRPRRKASS